jgi:uncharacterized protein YkwD
MLLRQGILMLRFVTAAILAVCLAGCAMQMPSFTGALDTSEDKAPAPPPARTAGDTAKPKEGGEKPSTMTGSLSGFWDNVSSPFRSSGTQETASLSPAPGRTDAAASKFSPAEVQVMINAYRAKYGLPAVHINTKLNQAAQMQAEDLAKHDRISHYGSDGSDVEDRARRAGYTFRMIAENIGTGQRSASEVIQGWQKSPSHNKNLLLPDAEHMGIALVYNPNSEFKTFWALVLGKGA